MKPLSGKVVVLTGASRGLGVDMARAFSARGARLALAARSLDDLEKVRAELDTEAIAIPTDVRKIDSLKELVATTERELGPIDVLVNNAGVEFFLDFEDTPLTEIDNMIATNVTSVLSLTRLVLPSMVTRKSGHVTSISSVAGLNPVPHNSTYSASKHAIVGFSKSLRLEMADHNVEISCVCPGFVSAGMFARWEREAPRSVPAVTPQEVAKAVVHAVEDNIGLVIVTKGLGKLGHVFGAIAPGLSETAIRKSGMVDYLREQAAFNASKKV
ncbi:MAG: SDR family NAD(P)-dependent oxidoreductase [Actinomycetota bacterium]